MEEVKNNLKETFVDDVDFFKSNEMDDRGKLLQKAIIPSVEKQKAAEVIKRKPKKVKKEIIKFKNEIQEMFKRLDEIIKEVVTTRKLSRSTGELVEYYGKFKNEFEWGINDMINYPRGVAEEGNKKAEESDYDKTRIRL